MRRLRFDQVGGAVLAPKPIDPAVRETVAGIFESLETGGDAALRELARDLDGLDDDAPLEVGHEEREAAVAGLPGDLRDALELSIGRVREAAEKHMAGIGRLTYEVGDSTIDVRPTPIGRVGAYVPGGRYPLPSTAVMTVVPAKVAGVGDVLVCSPRIHPHTIAAAHLSGADRLFRVGGAQAIAAMAVGTETVPGVDMVVGPGNSYVQAAKARAFGRVGIDMIAGPTEVLVVADRTADPRLVAADLLAQAEHDVEAAPILVTTEPGLVDAVLAEVEGQLDRLGTADVARGAVESNGLAIDVDDLDQAARLVNIKAPEHLEVVLEDPDAFIAKCMNFGCAFVGPQAFEVLGDYVLGTNHVLPTGGAGRYTAGLSVLSYLRFPAIVRAGPSDLPILTGAAGTLARAEGLLAHEAAAKLREK